MIPIGSRVERVLGAPLLLIDGHANSRPSRTSRACTSGALVLVREIWYIRGRQGVVDGATFVSHE